ncbi:MAG: hypothetical protein KF830_09385, partial [Planctomycetes bacterium]|nr:hypothetical protein [Planctomycetota bacterium]
MVALTLSPLLALVGALAAVALLVVYGLWAWERIVRRHREQLPGTVWHAAARARAARPGTAP